MVDSSTKRWTWRRVAEDNQAQLNKALELLQVAEAENERLRAALERLVDIGPSATLKEWRDAQTAGAQVLGR